MPSDNLTWVDDPLANGRALNWHDSAQGYAVGMYQSPGTQRVIDNFPWVELGIVESGTLILQGEGFRIGLHPGDCFVIPRGITLDWHQPGELRYLCMVFPGLSRTARIATDTEIPLALRDAKAFGEFYARLFEKAAEESGLKTVFTEFAWDAGWCDPCASPPPTRPTS